LTYTTPPFTQADTLELEEAAELMRLSHRRLVEAKAGVQAWRVAGAVWGLTVPYRKGWEALFIGRLEAITGMGDRSVRRGIKGCVESGALEWEPTRWIPPKGGSGRPSLIGLPGAPKATKPLQMSSGQPTPGRGQADSITNDSCQNYIAVKGNGHDHDPLGIEALTTEELRRGAREYGSTIAAIYRDELERREP
jgi:hypothetical protein